MMPHWLQVVLDPPIMSHTPAHVFYVCTIIMLSFLVMMRSMRKPPKETRWMSWVMLATAFIAFSYGWITLIGWRPELTQPCTHHCFPWGD